MPGRAWRPQVQGRHSFTVRNGGGERNRRAAVAARFRRRTGPKRLRLWHRALPRSEEHTSELQSLMRISYAVFCLKKKKRAKKKTITKRDRQINTHITYHKNQNKKKKTTQ